MKRLLKYIKPFTLWILLALLLLSTRAYSELSLPNYMSDIFDNGITLGGIRQGAPEIISDNGMKLLRLFSTPQRLAKLETAYEMQTGTASANYPLAEGKVVYILEKPSTQADSAYISAASAFVAFIRSAVADPSTLVDRTEAEAVMQNAGGMDDLNIEAIYAYLPMLESMPEGSFDDMIKEAESQPAMSAKTATVVTGLFYKELGADLKSIQSKYIWAAGLRMLALTLLSVSAAICVGFIASRVGASVAMRVRRDVFDRVNRFSSAEIDRFSTASLITRTTNDVQQLQMMLVMGIRMMGFAPVMGIGGTILALNKSRSLGWIIALAVAILITIIVILLLIVLPRFKMLQKLIDRLNLVSRESLSGLMVIRAFGNESREEERFDQANTNLTNLGIFLQRWAAFLMPAMNFIMSGIALLITWVGAKQIAAGSFEIGNMIAFIQYSMHIILSFMFLSMMFVNIPRATVSARRIAEVLNSESSVKDLPDAIHPDNLTGKIEFNNVFFRYSNAEKDVLTDISFIAEPGTTTAFIGSTGAGKSTLVNLIPRFYDTTDGEVLLDGINVKSLPQSLLRESIGYVPQKGVLFSGTIASNIRYGDEDATEEEIDLALKIAQAHNFVTEKDGGLEHPISQGGTNVSGGQKQRLAIARALIKRAPVYIFDDSFSALDFRTDAALRKALVEYTRDSAVLIVAQRVSTIMNAEKIIVLDEGRIVGMGKHKDLLQTCPAYREIAESQLSKEELS